MDTTSTNLSEKEILKQRAKVLAKLNIDTLLQNEEKSSLLCFQLADQTYCIDTEYIKEVLILKDLTMIPNTPEFILGVINVRGQILAIYNTKKLFKIKEIGITDQNKIIILKDNEKEIEFGILVDRIIGNINLSLHEIETIQDNLNEIGKEYLKGLTKEGYIVINTKAFIQSPALLVNSK